MNNKELTLNTLIEAIDKIEYDYSKKVTVLKCSPLYHQRLDRYFASLEAERILNGIEEPAPTPGCDICGVKIVVDKNMKPNEWRLE